MKEVKENLREIVKKHHDLMWLMLLLFVGSLGLLITTLTTLNPNVSVTNIGYGDIGGYRTGGWVNMLTFAIFAIVLGIFHNLLAVKIFHKKGDGLAKVLIIISMFLLVGAFIVLIRLLGEG